MVSEKQFLTVYMLAKNFMTSFSLQWFNHKQVLCESNSKIFGEPSVSMDGVMVDFGSLKGLHSLC